MINVLSALWERKGKEIRNKKGTLVISHVASEVTQFFDIIVRDFATGYNVIIELLPVIVKTQRV